MSAAIPRRAYGRKKARVTRPKPVNTRPPRRESQRPPSWYNPHIASRGLTRDTGFGPVDDVAVARVLAGRGPTTLTYADRYALVEKLAARTGATRWNGQVTTGQVATAAGIPLETLKKLIAAIRAGRLDLVASMLDRLEAGSDDG